MVFLNAAAAQGHAGSELETALREIVVQLVSKGVSQEEVRRAKVQLLAQLAYRRDSFFAQAMELGELESTGLSFRDVAAKYLVDDALTVGLLDPQPLGRGTSAPAIPAAGH
jgi:zinc protease